MKKAYGRMSGDNISVIVIKFTKPKPKKPLKSAYDLTSNTYEWLKWCLEIIEIINLYEKSSVIYSQL